MTSTGRRISDAVPGLGTGWPDADRPVLAAATRALNPVAASVRTVSGSPAEVHAGPRAGAGGRGVGLDGVRRIPQLPGAGPTHGFMVPVDSASGTPLRTAMRPLARQCVKAPFAVPADVEQRHDVPAA